MDRTGLTSVPPTGLDIMIERIDRPLSETERRHLEESLAPLPHNRFAFAARIVWRTGLVVANLVVVGFVAFMVINGPRTAQLVILSLLVGLVLGALPASLLVQEISNARRWAGASEQWHARCKAQLENGRAQVQRVTAGKVITVMPFDDEGEAYIYGLLGGGSLIICEQWVGPEDHGPWPAGQFEIVRSALDGELLGIFNTQDALTPLLELNWNYFKDRWGPPVFGIRVEDKRPEQILADWGYDPTIGRPFSEM